MTQRSLPPAPKGSPLAITVPMIHGIGFNAHQVEPNTWEIFTSFRHASTGERFWGTVAEARQRLKSYSAAYLPVRQQRSAFRKSQKARNLPCAA